MVRAGRAHPPPIREHLPGLRVIEREATKCLAREDSSNTPRIEPDLEPEQFMHVYGEEARAAVQKHGRTLQLWLQAFSIPQGREDELLTGIRVAEELGATHLAAWSYEGTSSMSQIRCARPQIVWSRLGEEFRRLRQAS